MKYDILISLCDEHNEGNILATKKYQVTKALYLSTKSNYNYLNSLESFYLNNMKKVKFLKEKINEGSFDEINNILDKYKSENTLVSITGGERINSLILFKLARDKNIPCIYIDILKKIIYYFDDSITTKKEELDDLDIEDVVEAFGGNLIDDSCNLCNKDDIVIITKAISSNLPLWHKYKQRLYDTTLFSHDYTNTSKVTIHLEHLNKDEEILLYKCLDTLKELHGISYERTSTSINVTFLNSYLKSFLFKSGTWLEVATNLLINEIKDIDEVKNGVMFLWNKDNRILRNEVDIVAIKDSVLICISCKDSKKYNENALNELNVYSEKLGGKNVCKILVATKSPEKLAVSERAKEMGIHLVIFDGDENKFKNTIKVIVKNIGAN